MGLGLSALTRSLEPVRRLEKRNGASLSRLLAKHPDLPYPPPGIMQRQTSIATREIHGSIASLEDRMRRLEGLVGGIADRLGVERGLAPTLLRTRAPTDALNLTLTLNRTRTRTLYTNPYPNRYPQGQLTLPLAPAHPGRHLGWVPARGCTIRPMPVAVTCMST